MLTITALIRVKKNSERIMADALSTVADNVRLNEPDTIGFFVSQDSKDPCLFSTYERFTDQAAMNRHNSSDVVTRFFAIAKPILDGEVTLIQGTELSSKT
jgi:quinol monooxygenase YgiN